MANVFTEQNETNALDSIQEQMMPDRISKEQRSWNMSRIRSKDTKPEILIRKALHRMGFRFRLHHQELPGKPDIVLAKHHAVMFINGCFWHGHEGCKRVYQPQSNASFWAAKITKNKERDKWAISTLEEKGWHVYVLWECEIADNEEKNVELLGKKSPILFKGYEE